MEHHSKVVQCSSPEVCCLEVQTDSDDFISEARFSSDDAKAHYYTGLPGGEMLKLFFKFAWDPFQVVKKMHFTGSFYFLLC